MFWLYLSHKISSSSHKNQSSNLSEGRFDLSTFRSERTNEASTLTITPKRASSRDVDTSSYRYHTAPAVWSYARLILTQLVKEMCFIELHATRSDRSALLGPCVKEACPPERFPGIPVFSCL
ncbi:hypothetical protein TNCV_2497611 [Trichonephila clavipes]|nr:hypothetical protein TNCV_2497611 [Trichonephila clavipes]